MTQSATAMKRAGAEHWTNWSVTFSNTKMEIAMVAHEVVSKEQGLKASRDLLVEEKAWTRERDRLSQKRRALPWVRVEKDYVFAGERGPGALAELVVGRLPPAV